MSASDEIIQKYQDGAEYDHGFVTDIDTIEVPKGLSEETIKFISNQKKETDSKLIRFFWRSVFLKLKRLLWS